MSFDEDEGTARGRRGEAWIELLVEGLEPDDTVRKEPIMWSCSPDDGPVTVWSRGPADGSAWVRPGMDQM